MGFNSAFKALNTFRVSQILRKADYNERWL